MNQASPEIRSEQAISYHGLVLDDEIEDFMVLNVRNREHTGREIETVGTNDGLLSIHQRKIVEPLEVQFMIRSKDDASYFDSFKRLKKMLLKEESGEISFEDEDAYYFGRFSNFSQIDDNFANVIVGTFEIFRETAYKYTEEKTTSGLVENLDDDIEIFEIEITTNVALSNLEITNDSQSIRLIEPIGINDTVVLDVRKGNAWKNGEPFDYAVAMNSDFDNFKVSGGETIQSDNGELLIRYRGRWE